MCGFRDAAYFSRAFRRRTGVTPCQWRRQYRRL
ncbi:MAG: AraC family transcriptional regulator, partial [Alphaproteobacteria bacterium]